MACREEYMTQYAEECLGLFEVISFGEEGG